MRSKTFWLSILLISFLFAPAGHCVQEPVADVPDFSFTAQTGGPVALNDLKGSVWIANFIFTRCNTECPMLTAKMAGLQKQLPLKNIKLVSFSVDPEHDTAEVLKKYAQTFKADEAKWLFLTADNQEQMWKFLREGLKIGVGKASQEEIDSGSQALSHSNRFVLVDKEGQIRGYYNSQEAEDMRQIAEDAKHLAK